MQLPFAIPDDVLGAMITPAVLISASGTLILSTSNRLGRIVDRVRALADVADELRDPAKVPADEVDERREWLSNQLVWQVRRIHLLQTAITVLYAAVGLLVGASLSVGLSAAAGGHLRWIPVSLGLVGATALFVASLLLVRETRMAVRATLLDMAYIQSTVRRRTARPPADGA